MIEPMTQQRLAEIKARCEAATPGPWRWWSMPGILGSANGQAVIDDGEGYGICMSEEDGNFIVHARQDIPALLAEVERLREELAALRADIEAGRLVRVPCKPCNYDWRGPEPGREEK